MAGLAMTMSESTQAALVASLNAGLIVPPEPNYCHEYVLSYYEFAQFCQEVARLSESSEPTPEVVMRAFQNLFSHLPLTSLSATLESLERPVTPADCQ